LILLFSRLSLFLLFVVVWIKFLRCFVFYPLPLPLKTPLDPPCRSMIHSMVTRTHLMPGELGILLSARPRSLLLVISSLLVIFYPLPLPLKTPLDPPCRSMTHSMVTRTYLMPGELGVLLSARPRNLLLVIWSSICTGWSSCRVRQSHLPRRALKSHLHRFVPQFWSFWVPFSWYLSSAARRFDRTAKLA
jgi:hypothetical protein